MICDDTAPIIDINVVGDADSPPTDPEFSELTRLPDVTVDSGAGAPVANPKHYPGAVVVPSEGSRRGQQFVGPSGHTMKNQGEMSPLMVLESGQTGAVKFQAADVRKPLLAVSSCNKKGNPVWFDSDESFIITGSSPEVKQIRALIQQIKNKVRLHQKNGTYIMKSWAPPKGPFRGQGR